MTLGFIGEFDESIAELEKAVEAAPAQTSAAGWADLNLWKSYQMLGMFEESKAPLLKVLDNPNADPRHREEAEKQINYLKESGL
jgi:tetratricopeptide (TPR) repeat protein